MRVLVAGGAGFIGSHLCARLVRDGHQVICVDNLLTGSERNLAALAGDAAFSIVHHDVAEPFSPTDGVEAIFHLASPASPIGYWTHPFETIRANSEGTWRLLDLAEASGARFLLASTSEVYGDPLQHPQREDYWGNVNPVGTRACYDESKRLGETITMEFTRRRGVDARIVRIFNTYGPHSQLDDGRMIPNFITQALTGGPLTIFGTGDQTRSICYVDDLVDGLVCAMFHDATTGEIFNLGNPEEHSVLDWARTIIRLCGSSSPVVFEPRRDDDPERRQPDITKAAAVLGWTPGVTPQQGLRRTIAWFRAQLAGATAPDGLLARAGTTR